MHCPVNNFTKHRRVELHMLEVLQAWNVLHKTSEKKSVVFAIGMRRDSVHTHFCPEKMAHACNKLIWTEAHQTAVIVYCLVNDCVHILNKLTMIVIQANHVDVAKFLFFHCNYFQNPLHQALILLI